MVSLMWLIATILNSGDRSPTVVFHASKFMDLLVLEYMGGRLVGIVSILSKMSLAFSFTFKLNKISININTDRRLLYLCVYIFMLFQE